MSRRASVQVEDEPDLWRALANPWRRRLLDLLRDHPATTGALAREVPELSRFAVMQHLGVLTEAGLVLVERRGRDRVNHLNAVPLREWYERWVQPLADVGSAELLAFKRAVETEVESEEDVMTTSSGTDTIRTVRLSFELRISASPERTFEVMTQRVLDWNPHTYGDERTQAVVVEPRVGGRHYEDWGDGAGHLYGHVTAYDPPNRWATRGRLSPGTTLDSEYKITETDDGVIVHVTKVAVGPLSEDEAAGIAEYGDLRRYTTAIEQLAAG